MEKKNGLENSELYKIANKIDGVSYFTFLTKTEMEKLKAGEGFIYSPNKEYIFKVGNKIDGSKLVSCAMSIRLEDYSIVEAKELPKSSEFNFSLKKGNEEFKEVVESMIKQNQELYESMEIER